MKANHRWCLRNSYYFCEKVARKNAGNFYPAFLLLPKEQRLAMSALYTFMRVADDLCDVETNLLTKKTNFNLWRKWFHLCMEGEYHHPVFPALRDSISRFGIPRIHVEEVLNGIEMDLEINSYPTFSELYKYCYCVASAVGLCCVYIWGFKGEPFILAENAGIAFQLTNILRDVGEDANKGRIYLPQEDLNKFGYTSEDLSNNLWNTGFKNLMNFEALRAMDYYRLGLPLENYLDFPGRSVFRAMLKIYRATLEMIISRNFRVFEQRVSISRFRKLQILLSSLSSGKIID